MRCSFTGPISTVSFKSEIRTRLSSTFSPTCASDEILRNTIYKSDRSPTSGTSLEVATLELLHFYTVATSLTLSSRPELQRIWQDVVPRLAFSHQFLLHGILAFSALHLARLQPERKTLLDTQASAHHDTGLTLFKIAMSNITPENCDACFAFSSITAAYAWASSDQSGDLFFLESSACGDVEWVSLLRGVHTLLKVAGEWMEGGAMKLMLQPRHLEPELARAMDPEVSDKLTTLSQLWDCSAHLNLHEVEALNETLALLQEACGLVASSIIDPEIDVILVVYGWPIQVPETFFTMVKDQKPEALILLAHYSILLDKVNQLWYTKGMSRRLLQTIHNKLGKEWECWLTWPLQNLVLTEFEDLRLTENCL